LPLPPPCCHAEGWSSSVLSVVRRRHPPRSHL
jgi:hypothetical protein